MQIDIMNETDISIISRFLTDDRISVVSCAPGLAANLMNLRRKYQAKFKIMIQSDFNNGSSFGIDKFVGFTADDFDADGYEIYVNMSDPIDKVIASINCVYGFIIDQINPDAVLCLAVNHDLVSNIQLLADLPTPEEFRFGIEHKPPAVSFNYRIYNQTASKIRDIIGPDSILKICGNIDSKVAVTSVLGIDNYTRCILSARQFTTFVKDKKQ